VHGDQGDEEPLQRPPGLAEKPRLLAVHARKEEDGPWPSGSRRASPWTSRWPAPAALSTLLLAKVMG
jgi:hypothetical protein